MTFLVCNDRQHAHHQALPTRRQSQLRSIGIGFTIADPAQHLTPASMPETPLCSFHPRPTDPHRVGRRSEPRPQTSPRHRGAAHQYGVEGRNGR